MRKTLLGQRNDRPNLRFCLLFLVSLSSLLFHACRKDNLDYSYDYRREQDNRKSSLIRLINLSQNPQLIANGDSLTNFFLPPQRPGYIPPEELTPPGTHYFPKDGRLGQSWSIPQELFLPDGTLHLKTTFIPTPTNNIASHDVEFTVKEGNNEAKDYYLLLNHEAVVQQPKQVVEVPRSVTAPAKADHFKIRIINFGKKLPSSSSMEDIATPISLTYADGTPVGAATSGIGENKWSDYVEIPYGTYQFKILTADGRQIPAVGQRYYNYIDRFNSTMEMGNIGSIPSMSSGLTYAPVQTFQPGGIYSIVVHPATFTWTTGNDDIREFQNGFQILADISEPQNRTYSQIQLANALNGEDLVMQVKGQATTSTAYGTASTYQRVVSGRQTIAVQSSAGKLVLSEEVELLEGQNYTVWLYADKDKNAKALVAANNLAGTGFIGSENEGTNATIDRYRSNYMFNFRFLNFCPQLPYATFTNGEGLPFGDLQMDSGVNLPLGTLKITHPYSSVLYSQSNEQGGPYQIMAYSSTPNRIPGDWLTQVAPLISTQLVANPNLYTAVGRKIPAHEPGVYSIALIGELGDITGADKARFMVVKHTR